MNTIEIKELATKCADQIDRRIAELSEIYAGVAAQYHHGVEETTALITEALTAAVQGQKQPIPANVAASVSRLSKDLPDFSHYMLNNARVTLMSSTVERHNQDVHAVLEYLARPATPPEAGPGDKEIVDFMEMNACEVTVEWDDGDGPIPPEWSIRMKDGGILGHGNSLRSALRSAMEQKGAK